MEDQDKKEMIDIIRQALKPDNEFMLANQPFQSGEEKAESERFILKPNESKQVDKQLESFKTDTFLDDLFLNSKEESIGGLPHSGSFGILGMPDAGKSILMEEIAVKVSASGRKVLFITSEDIWRSETLRFDLESRMKQKADILGLEWSKVQENLFVMDTVTYSELNEWFKFVETYRYACKTYGIELVIVDSVTVLQNYRGALKYRLMELIKYGQLHGITGLFVNQRSKAEWDSYDIAGGIGLAHNLDGTIIIDFGRTYHTQINEDLGTKRGVDVRIVRVLGCRICGFNRHYQKVEIDSDGFLKLVET